MRDGDGYSFLTASESSMPSIHSEASISGSIVKLLLVPSTSNVQMPYPYSVEPLVEFVAIPLVGRAKTFQALEEALLIADKKVQARVCESILYLSGLPHRCLQAQERQDGRFVDKGIRNAVEVQRESFSLVRNPTLARAAAISRCMKNLPADVDRKIDPHEDCARFADAVLSASSLDWEPMQ